MKILSLFLLLASCVAQVPDAPKPQKQPTTCIDAFRHNGKPCPEWVHRLVGQYPPIPFNPPPRTEPARFFEVQENDQAPLRSNKQVLHSKLFLGLHAGMAVAMIVACTHRNSGETWASEAPAVGGLTALDFLADRFLMEPIALGPPVYGMVHYSISASK